MKNKNEMALFRFSIIAPLVNGTHNCSSINEYAKLASKKKYEFHGEWNVYSKSTIKRWYYNYLKYGYEGLITPTRTDYREPRALGEDAMKEIQRLVTGYPRMTATAIYSQLIRSGVIRQQDVSLKTVQRYVRTLKAAMPQSENERRRFSCAAPNDMWQSDTSVGPYILVDGKKYRTYLIMFIDDYSRLITGYGFYLNDNAINMQLTFKRAISVYGVPKILYVDNGGPYINQQTKIICARLGVMHRNTRPYDPESKGKIERCFRTIKSQWMNAENWNNFRSIADVENSFSKYVIRYNNTIHGSTGKSPNDAFHEYESIKRISRDKLDEMFRHELKRTADATSCISIDRRLYEVPRECIGVECTYTFNPQNLKVVYYGNIPCKLLDPVANSKKKRRANISFQGVINDENGVLELEDEHDEIS